MRSFISRILYSGLTAAVLAWAPAAYALPPRVPDPNELSLRARTFVPPASRPPGAAHQGRHLLIQFEAGRSKEVLAALRAQRVRVLEAVPRNAVSAWVPAGVDPAAVPGVRWTGLLAPRDKLAYPLDVYARQVRVLVDVFPDVQRSAAIDAIRRAGGREIPNSYLLESTYHVEIAATALGALAAQDEISFVYRASDSIERNLPVRGCSGAIAQNGLVVPNYVANSEGWDGPGAGSAALQYFFENTTPDVANAQNEVVRALAEWSRWAAISWSLASSARQLAALDFRWARGSHGDGDPFDGPGQTLAHAYYPTPTNAEPSAGDVHFDEDEDWRIGADVDVFTIALHETGHSLGLGHSDDPSAVMYAYYSGPRGGLTADDVAGIRSIYARVGGSIGDAYEPDDDASSAHPLHNSLEKSIVPASDVDFVSFTLTWPADVTISTSAYQLSDDTLLSLYDAQGTLLETNDDYGVALFSRIERSRAGGDALPAGTYYVSAEESGNDAEIARYSVSLQVFNHPAADYREPDDTLAQAVPIAPTGRHPWAQTIWPIGDRDYSAFTITELSEVTISASGGLIRFPGDTEMWLLTSDGNVLDYSDNTYGHPGATIFRTREDARWLQPGAYYVVVGEKGDDADLTYELRLSVTPVLYGGDDAYEENDTLAGAWDASGISYLSEVGYQWDDDYYRVHVERNQGRVYVGTSWHAGQVDIRLLDGNGAVLAVSENPTGSDQINTIVPSSGTYYVHVYGGNVGEYYELSWQTSGWLTNDPPPNDDFAARLTLAGESVITLGDNYASTKEPGEPAHAGDAGGRSVWWRWTAPRTADVEITTSSQLDTLLAVYTGTRVDALALVAENDNAQGLLSSGVAFRASANVEYAIAVDGRAGAEGGMNVAIEPVPPPPPPPPPPPGNVQIAWSSLQSKCKASTQVCKLKAKLALQNVGTTASSPTQIHILLSDNASFDIDDVLITGASVPSLRPSATKKQRLKTTLAPGATVSGKFLIAIAVSGPWSHEVVYGPMR